MIRRKPYVIFIPIILILVIAGFFTTEETFDINIHDTYYVISHSYFYFLLAILSFLNFMIYFCFEKFKIDLLKSLAFVQILIFLISMIGLFFPYNLIFSDDKFPLFDNGEKINFYLSISAFLLIISQFLLILNIFVTTIKSISLLLVKKQK
jgi:heme/copper-type cytochrome/quinol oxidase subunit 1